MQSRFKRQLETILKNEKLTPAKRAAVEACLADENCLSAAYSATRYRHRKLARTGVVTDFLQWLLDHADEIIAVVAKIVALFAKL